MIQVVELGELQLISLDFDWIEVSGILKWGAIVQWNRLRVLLGQWGRCRPIYFVVVVWCGQNKSEKRRAAAAATATRKEKKRGWFLSLWSAQLALIYYIMSFWNASHPTKIRVISQLNLLVYFCSLLEYFLHNFVVENSSGQWTKLIGFEFACRAVAETHFVA